MSQIGQPSAPQPSHPRLRPFEQAPRPLVGYAHDYPDGYHTGRHQHPRAQLLYATTGLMRIETDDAHYAVPPGSGLWVPAGASHAVRTDGEVRMRALFLRADAARAGPREISLIAISPLLRELILAACAEPLAWEKRGRVGHIAALAIDEIGRAASRPLSLPVARDPRLARVTQALLADPMDGRGLAEHAEAAGASVRTLARLFRAETGMSFQQWRRQLRMTEALARLAQGEPPERAAARVGYASVPAFGAAFRSVFGTTPGRVGKAGVGSAVGLGQSSLR